MNVSAVLVTRGDVDMTAILDSLTAGGIDDIVVWDNAEREDLAVYGRYAAIAEAKHDLIYVQDDDCVLPPESLRRIVEGLSPALHGDSWKEVLCANMPQPFRHDFYEDHSLVGFGAVFHRDLPKKAFDRLARPGSPELWTSVASGDGWFQRTCDVVFTALTPRVLVDVPYENLPWAEDETRMYRQNGHVGERQRMLELVRKVRDAG